MLQNQSTKKLCVISNTWTNRVRSRRIVRMNVLSPADVFERLGRLDKKREYHAMYSSLLEGVVLESKAMVLPIDDHMVHRGDGVFEAMRSENGKVYLMEPHIDRLVKSAEMVSMPLPKSKEEIISICDYLAGFVKVPRVLLRLFVSRGPGDFSPNPYSTVGSQLYIVVTDFSSKATSSIYENGASLMVSDQPVKPIFYSRAKTCNYLPNVLMKKQSIDRGCDFAVNFTEDGFLAEGPTENILVLTETGHLVNPRFDYTLRGTTLVRLLDLCQREGIAYETRDITRKELESAREIMMVGTTLEALPVTKLEGQPVGDGRVGPMAKRLRQLILDDLKSF